MNIVEETGGIPREVKQITIPHGSWKKLSELGCTLVYGNQIATKAILRIPDGKEIEMHTSATAVAGTGFILNDKFIVELQSSQEINTMLFRAIGGVDIVTSVIILTSQVG